MFTVTRWHEGYSWRRGQLGGFLVRRRLPLWIWLLDRWHVRAHRVPVLRRVIMWREWCFGIEAWFEGQGDRWMVRVPAESLSPEFRAKHAERWAQRAAWWQARQAREAQPGVVPGAEMPTQANGEPGQS